MTISMRSCLFRQSRPHMNNSLPAEAGVFYVECMYFKDGGGLVWGGNTSYLLVFVDRFLFVLSSIKLAWPTGHATPRVTSFIEGRLAMNWRKHGDSWTSMGKGLTTGQSSVPRSQNVDAGVSKTVWLNTQPNLKCSLLRQIGRYRCLGPRWKELTVNL